MLYQLRHHRVPTQSHLGPLVRFAGEHLVPGLQAAGVEVVGCFTTLSGPQPRFTTLLAFPDANAWHDQLAAFEASAAWRAMEPGLFPGGQALVTGYQTVLLRPTAYSREARASLGEARAGVFEERTYHTADARAHARNAARMGATIPVLHRHGMHLVGFWDVVAGAAQSALYYLVRYASLAERMPQWEAFGADPERAAIRAAAEAEGPLFRHVDSNFLQPTAFSPLQ